MIRNRLFALLALLALPLGVLAQVPPVEGKDYLLISPAQPFAPTPGKIEVVEVFGYGCIHCAHFEPLLQAWKKKLPADVQFSYLPLSSGGIWEAFGRAYFAAESMGVLAQSHEAMFKAIHLEKTLRALEEIPQFYAQFGVDPKVFESTMNSFAVNAKIARAKQVTPRWAIEGTPTMVVNGKYRVMSTPDGGQQGMLRTVDWLVAKERTAQTGGQ